VIDPDQCNSTKFETGTTRIEHQEAMMRKEFLEDNKSHWMLFEQVSSPSSAIMWAVVAGIVVLGILYFVA
jgi:hypothetical protein